MDNYTSNNSKGLVLEFYLEYPKTLRELHNDYSLDPDKIEIKREMLPSYQLKIADSFNVLIGNVKNLVSKFLVKKSMCFILKTYNFI